MRLPPESKILALHEATAQLLQVAHEHSWSEARLLRAFRGLLRRIWGRRLRECVTLISVNVQMCYVKAVWSSVSKEDENGDPLLTAQVRPDGTPVPAPFQFEVRLAELISDETES